MRAADASTFVAELLFASACHGWASLIALHPELALRALLELRPSCEIDKGLILRVETLVAAILLAAHALVVLAPAFEAVVLAAALAVELRNAGVILEGKLAVGGWAPASVPPIPLDIPIHLVAIVPALQLGGTEVEQLLVAHFDAALLLGAADDQLSTLDHVLGVEMEAADMEGVPALKVCCVLSLQLGTAD